MSLCLSRSSSQGGSLQEQQAGRALSHRGPTQECIVCVRKTGQLGQNSAPSSLNLACGRGNALYLLSREKTVRMNYYTLLNVALRAAPCVVLCCKTRVTYTHTQVSRGGILKVASECSGTESTHSKLRLRLCGKPGLEYDFNLTQKHILKVEN